MNKKIFAALLLNIAVVIATASIVASYFFYSRNPLVKSGFDSFQFFTTDSNVLAALSSLVMIPYEVQIMRGKRKKLPHAAIVFKYIGMTSVMLTFLTVMVLLMPTYGAVFTLLGTTFYMHLTGPLTALATFLFLETDSKIKLPETVLAIIPSLLYGAVYLTQVVFIGEKNGGWSDFYTFTRGGYWYIAMVVIIGVSYLIAVLTRLVHNKMTKE